MRARAVAFAVLLLLSCMPSSRARQPDQPGSEQATSALVERPRGAGLTDPAELRPAPSRVGPGASREAKHRARLAELEHLSDDELAKRIDRDIESLGSMSLGRPNAGALVNGVQLPEGDHWEVVVPHSAWATEETIDYLITAIEHVNAGFPDSHKAYVGDMSRELGGPLRPHRSHQSGRDVDVGYYYLPDKAAWYQRASARTLDIERTWAFVRALLTETDVEMMFIDLRVQQLLKEHALAEGEDPDWLDEVFQYRSKRLARTHLIRHTWGHASHIHVRFYNPHAQELGRRCYAQLVDRGLITPRHRYVRYHARAGDSLATVASRAGTSVTALRQMNGLRSGGLVAGRNYLVPLRGRVALVREVLIPPRLLPPTLAAAGPMPAPAAAPAP